MVYTGPNCTRSHRFAETTRYKFVVGPNNDINVHSAITYVKSSAAREGMSDAKWQTSRVTNDKSKRHTSYTPASSASCEHANISATRDWLTAASFERFAFVPGVVYSYRCFFFIFAAPTVGVDKPLTDARAWWKGARERVNSQLFRKLWHA